jgi:flagellar motor switch protein FliG
MNQEAQPILAGAEKAIAFLLSVGEERAKRIVRHLDDQQIRRLTEALDAMHSVSTIQVDQVFADFGSSRQHHALALGSGAQMMHRIATELVGAERADDLITRKIETPEPLHILNRIDPETLAGLLAKEHPQSLAALLAHADVQKSAAVLQHLAPDVQREVVRRMASLESIPSTTIEEAERVLREELALVSEAKVARVNGVKRAADLVSKLETSVSARLLEELDESNEELSLAIKRAMFTFEDLRAVDKRDMQTLLRDVGGEQLKLALKTASPDLRDHIVGSMSRRAAEMLLDDLESMGPVKLSVVEEAQNAIVEIALKLQTDGKITIAGGGGEEMV